MDRVNKLAFKLDLLNLKVQINNSLISALSIESLLEHCNSSLKEIFERLDESLGDSGIDRNAYFHGIFLVNIVSGIELYFVELMKTILKRYPKKISGIEFSLSDVLGYSDDEIIRIASERYINEIMYKKPLDYMSKLCEILSIQKADIETFWPSYIETKARRDLGIHNNWIINDVYIRKTNEVGIKTNKIEGSNLCPEEEYLHQRFDEIKQLIDRINSLVILKYQLENIT